MGKKGFKKFLGSFRHCNFKGSILFLLEVPIHKALVFFLFNCKPDNTRNELTIFMAFLSDVVSSRIRVVSSAARETVRSWHSVHLGARCPAKAGLAYFEG